MIQTVLLDVDGVLVDLATPVWVAAQDILQKSLPPPEAWEAYDFAKAMQLTPSQAPRMYNVLRKRDNLAAQAQWYPGAISFVHQLVQHGFDVCFVTKPWDGMPSWQKDRKRQLHEHFPNQDVLFLGEKRRVIGQHLIDDCVAHIKHDRFRGLLFDRPWNRGPDSRGCRRVMNYEHALKRIICGEIDETTEIITELGRSEDGVEKATAKAETRAGTGR